MNDSKELQVVVAGHICFDVIPAFKNMTIDLAQ